MFASRNMFTTFVGLLAIQCRLVDALVARDDLQKRAVAYFDPLAGGGSMLDSTGNGLGEPLNVRLGSSVLFLSSTSSILPLLPDAEVLAPQRSCRVRSLPFFC